MLNIAPVESVISKDNQLSAVMSILPPNAPIKINLGGKTGILLDEGHYDGLLETLRILQENPNIVHSLKERESGDFISEEEFMKYV